MPNALLGALGVLASGALVVAIAMILQRRAGKPGAEPPPKGDVPPRVLAAQAEGKEAVVANLTKAEAEQLLDWLEANGYENSGLSCDAGAGFEVRFKMPRDSAGTPG